MGAVTVVEWAHDLQMCLATVGTGIFINDKVAGVALVLSFFFGNIFEFFVFFCYFRLLYAPIHTTTSRQSLINI